VLKERAVPAPEELSPRAYSKEHMAQERKELAAKIVAERRSGRDVLSELRVRSSLLAKTIEQKQLDAEALKTEIARLESQRTERANSLTGRIRATLGIKSSGDYKIERDMDDAADDLEMTQDEKVQASSELTESINQLVEADANLKGLRQRITDHYAEAGDKMHRTVEQTMLRNGAFFVHTIDEDERTRHNDNSNVSKETQFEDDLNILLSLEPSVSASSLLPGVDNDGYVSGIWTGAGGVIVSGGRISEAEHQDLGTVSRGIKNRSTYNTRAEKTSTEIDAVIHAPRRSRLGDYSGGYNEFVINDPEVSGYFKQGAIDETGTAWAYGLETRQELATLHKLYETPMRKEEYGDALRTFNRNLSRYKERFDLIRAKGLPFYVLTPDRKFYEVLQVNDNGTLSLGPELTPEAAATGKAGLPSEERKRLGAELLQKRIFKHDKAHQEAEELLRAA
jgi:hypothetical protein